MKGVAAKLGFLVNPVAGIGGAAGLKGSDAPDIRAVARLQGLVSAAPLRGRQALATLVDTLHGIEVLTYPAEMGADVAHEIGLDPRILGTIAPGATTGADTRRAAVELEDAGVDLLLFVGGDGTAADILRAVGDRVVVVGAPSGVKMHSAVFGVTARAAGRTAARYLSGELAEVCLAEVVDVTQASASPTRFSPELLGYARVPCERRLIQHGKARAASTERASLRGLAADLRPELLADDVVHVVGPGTTTAAILRGIGLESALLGVDVIDSGRLIATDVDERGLLELIESRRARVLVSPIGGQGFLFGRGNQQISATVLERVGLDNVVIVATEAKLAALGGRPLLVDTGDERVDRMLAGVVRVRTGPGRVVAYRVAPPPE